MDFNTIHTPMYCNIPSCSCPNNQLINNFGYPPEAPQQAPISPIFSINNFYQFEFPANIPQTQQNTQINNTTPIHNIAKHQQQTPQMPITPITPMAPMTYQTPYQQTYQNYTPFEQISPEYFQQPHQQYLGEQQHQGQIVQDQGAGSTQWEGIGQYAQVDTSFSNISTPSTLSSNSFLSSTYSFDGSQSSASNGVPHELHTPMPNSCNMPEMKEVMEEEINMGRHLKPLHDELSINVLERWFKKHPFVDADDKKAISSQTHLTPDQVRIWFQNKRFSMKSRFGINYVYKKKKSVKVPRSKKGKKEKNHRKNL